MLFATVGPGAILTGTAPKPGASEDAQHQEGQFNPWDEEEPTAELEYDPALADKGPDGMPRKTFRASQ